MKDKDKGLERRERFNRICKKGRWFGRQATVGSASRKHHTLVSFLGLLVISLNKRKVKRKMSFEANDLNLSSKLGGEAD